MLPRPPRPRQTSRADSGDHFWISGPRKDGADRLYGESLPVEIDDDVRDEYRTEIRAQAQRAHDKIANR